MDFNEFLPNREEYEKEDSASLSDASDKNSRIVEKIGQEQFYKVISGRQPDWQTIIYDLINSEQLDPWDIDIIVLTKRYFEKIAELEEQDFYISSKILLAAALLLRIKSEFLLSRHIKSIDDILFGKKDEKKYILEKIQIDENELPLLIPKTPLPRARRITLNELMNALSNAINTETRRIKKEVALKRAKKLSEVDFPTFRKIDLKDRIKQFYARILTTIKKSALTGTSPSKDGSATDRDFNKTCYSNLVGKEKDEKLACFLPLLHLSNTKKLWLEQEKHLDEIWIFLYEYFEKNKDKFFEEAEEETADETADEALESENLDYKENSLDKARKAKDRKKEIAEEARKELEDELKIEIQDGVTEMIKNELMENIEQIEKEENIDEETGFSDEQ